jgi:uncharacterized repeat protein (TIGR01451 family)
VLAGTGGSAQAAAVCPPGFTPGNKLCLDTSHIQPPDTTFVTQSSVVTYRVLVANPGTATATKVTLTFTLDITNPPPGQRRMTVLTPLPSGCSAPADAPAPNAITCSLGSVKPSSTPREFLFNVQMPATAALTSSQARISADARASDKGNNPNDPTAEDFTDTPEVVDVRVVEGLGISAVPNGVTVPLDTDPDGSGATGTDVRTAKFTLVPVGFSTTANIVDSVEDSHFVCPSGLKCPGGGWTQAVIPGPGNNPFAPFLPPSRMDLELLYDADSLGNGFNLNHYVLLHDLDHNAATTDYEQITELCAGSNPTPPCLRQEPMLLPNGDLLVKALVQGNWRFR